MFVFSILLLPVAIALYYVKSETKSDLLLIITGILVGAFVVAIKAFFSFSHRIIPFSFFQNFLFLFLRESFCPGAILFAVFVIISKDTKEFKLKAFFPLVTSFYAIFLPFSVITSAESNHFFQIFIKPLIYLSSLYSLDLLLKFMGKKEKLIIKNIIVAILLYILITAIPPAIESAFLIGAKNIIWILSSIIFVLIPVVFDILQSHKKI